MNWLGTAKMKCRAPSATAAASVLTSRCCESLRPGRYQEFSRVVRISFMRHIEVTLLELATVPEG